MSTVLRFRVSRGRPTDGTPVRRACEIVIFPGVRRERHIEPEHFVPEEMLPDLDDHLGDRDGDAARSRKRQDG